MNSSRREFLIRTSGLGAFLPLAWATRPYLLKALGGVEVGRGPSDRILVVLQMAGGNDGVNTLVPFADDEYYKNRPVLAVRREQVLKLDDDAGLHPSMKAMKKLWDDGRLAVVQGVGYPNPNRSHFRATDIWESAIPEREETRTGWLGRAVDRAGLPEDAVPAIAAGEVSLPLTLVGERPGAVSILSLDAFRLQVADGDPAGRRRAILGTLLAARSVPDGSDLSFLCSASRLAYRCSERLEGVEAIPKGGSEIGKKLQLVARLIEAETGARIFHVSLGGFDTHADQPQGHQELLRQLSEAVAAFFTELERRGHSRRVLLMTFSEFGRRLRENKSRGTDHGAAAPLFLVSEAIRGGIYGTRPSLADLDDGDLRHTVDFRSVYRTVLTDFLGWNAAGILGGDFPAIALVR